MSSGAASQNDVVLLRRLGYKQEFKRDFSTLETFGVSFTIIGLVPSITSVIVFALPNGGAVSLVWGWTVASVFIVLISLALAELGSAAPTSGGLYYWTHKFASPGTRNLLAWICGYSNTIYLIAGTASITWSCAVQIFACVTIGSDLTFAATTGQIFGLFAGLIIIESILASLATRALARLQRLFIFTNLSLILAIIVALAAATPKAHMHEL